jgi:hypothetical protein
MKTTNRPPSCDLPAEHYDVLKGVKPCPMCGNSDVGFDISGGIYINEFVNDEVAVQCDSCGAQVNDRIHRESKGAAVKKWNSIPRRSEVLELLRLVDGLKDASSRTEVALALRHVIDCADKLRKEMVE